VKVLLFQLDGKIPNLALMRISAHHKALGDQVEFRWGLTTASCSPDLLDRPDKVYASTIFQKTKPVTERLLQTYPDAVVGGTGWDIKLDLEHKGITTQVQDYSIYPKWKQSIGFTQRGCRLACEFCVVRPKEGKEKPAQTIPEIWRGGDMPRQLLLLDNDFFGVDGWWQKRSEEIIDGKFSVSFNQGINARFLTEEAAETLGRMDCKDDQMQRKCIYTAWDNKKDGERLFAGLDRLVKNGFKPRDITVYILIAYWPGTGVEDWEYRRRELRAFGAMPYPMPFVRTPETIGFQRWVIGAYDKMGIPWEDWKAAGYQPRKLGIKKVEGQLEIDA
jgi:hypothetical protein